VKLIMENWRKFVNEAKNKDGKEQGADGKACWDGYKHAGTKDGKDECIPMEEGSQDQECPKCSGKDPEAKCECESEDALEEKNQKKNCGCGKDPCITYGSQNEEKQNSFKTHKMYDPNSDDVIDAETEEDHDEAGGDGYIHVDPETLRDILKDEGGAAGIDPFLDSDDIDADEGEIRDALEAMDDVGEHEDGDYILADDKEIIVKIVKEAIRFILEKKKKKKACKPSKGKRFAKRVKGKCRSYGQKGKAKDGGDRIRPGTKKGDAYCARSFKIKKCKNPPCANALSRKKWKCRGKKSVAE